MSQLVVWLLALPPALVLLAAFLFPALEASAFLGLVVPGETAVFVGGMAAHAGNASLWSVVLAAAAGAVVGDQVGYAVGRRYGRGLIDRLPRRLRAGGRVDRAVELVRQHGAVAVLVGRWTAVLRALLPSLAGASHLDQTRFTVVNAVGGATWATVVALLGYSAGAAYQQVIATMGRAGEIGLGVGLGVVIAAVVVAKRRRRRGNGLTPKPREAC